MEEVYKTMHLQLKILNRQRLSIEDLKRRLSEKSSKPTSQISVIKNTDNPYSENLGNTRYLQMLIFLFMKFPVNGKPYNPVPDDEKQIFLS